MKAPTENKEVSIAMCLCGDKLVSLPFGFQGSHCECPEIWRKDHLSCPFLPFALDKGVRAREADVSNIVPAIGYPSERAAPK